MANNAKRLDFPLSPQDYEAIGELAAHFSFLEFLAAVGVWHLLGVEAYDGALVTSNMPLERRIEVMIQLGVSAGKARTDILELGEIKKAVVKEKDGLTARRNEIIHALWSTADPKGRRAYPVTFRKSGRITMGGKLNAALMGPITDEICRQGARLQEVLARWECFTQPFKFQRPIP